MLPRSGRLTRGADFSAAVRGGRRAGGRLLVVHLEVSPDGLGARAGFVVSRAVGNAVVRNRVKRRLRHLVGERSSSLPDGSVLVVRALPASAEASSAELGEALDRGLRRATSLDHTGAPEVARR